MADGNRTATLLAAYLAARPAQPFDWCSNHCCHLTAQWVALATGRNPLAGLPATGNARRTLRLVRQLGGLQAACARQLGLAAVPAPMAQTGDVVLVPLEGVCLGGGQAVGICSGRHVVVADAQGALVFLPLAGAVCAWRLGAPA